MRLTEKYRPHTWEDVLGQPEIINAIRSNIERQSDWGLPHYLFVSPTPGTGKTTVARLIADMTKTPFFEFNASDDRGIDFVRIEVKRLSQFSGKRIIILEEADSLTPEAQHALRRIMEQTNGTTFILTGNHEYKIIDAIRSRCSIHRFKPLDPEIIRSKLIDVIKHENISIDMSNDESRKQVRDAIVLLTENANGDLRTALNNLEKIIDSNLSITPESVLSLQGSTDMHAIALSYAISGNFNACKDTIEKAYIEGGFNPILTFKQLYSAIDNISDQNIRIRLYSKLGDIEANSKLGCDPIIQIISFMAYAWVTPHLTSCPVLDPQG